MDGGKERVFRPARGRRVHEIMNNGTRVRRRNILPLISSPRFSLLPPRSRNRQAHHRLLRPRHWQDRALPGGEAIARIVRQFAAHRRRLSRRILPPREEASHPRVPPHHRTPTSADQYHRGRKSRTIGPRRGHTRALPGQRIPLRPDAVDHRVRLRGGRGDVPRHDLERRRRRCIATDQGREDRDVVRRRRSR